MLAEEHESLHGRLFESLVTNEELGEQIYAYKGEVGNYGRKSLEEEKLSAFRQLISTKHKALLDNIQELKSFSRGAGRLLFAFNDVDNITMTIDRQKTDLRDVATGHESLKTTYKQYGRHSSCHTLRSQIRRLL